MQVKIGFDADDFGRGLRRQLGAIKKRELESRARRVTGLRCREHGSAATITPTGLGFSIKACCEAFGAVIQRELRR